MSKPRKMLTHKTRYNSLRRRHRKSRKELCAVCLDRTFPELLVDRKCPNCRKEKKYLPDSRVIPGWAEASQQDRAYLMTWGQWPPEPIVPTTTLHEQVELDGVRVDVELVPILKMLWAAGFKTLFSCQGGLPARSSLEERVGRGYIKFVPGTRLEDAVQVLGWEKSPYALMHQTNNLRFPSVREMQSSKGLMGKPESKGIKGFRPTLVVLDEIDMSEES